MNQFSGLLIFTKPKFRNKFRLVDREIRRNLRNGFQRVRNELFNSLLILQGNKCFYCEGYFCQDELTIDHIFPICLGGTNNIGNLVICCVDCNDLKSKRETNICSSLQGNNV